MALRLVAADFEEPLTALLPKAAISLKSAALHGHDLLVAVFSIRGANGS
jgi:hypothetical protein